MIANPLDLKYIFVDLLAGDVAIFFFLFLFAIAIAGAMFRMPVMVLGVVGLIGIVLLNLTDLGAGGTARGFLILGVLILAFYVTGRLARQSGG
jgi:hypothetical protein